MRERVLITLVLIVLLHITSFGQAGSITGTITDDKTGETLIGATVIITGTTKGTVTNFDGYYSIDNLQPGTYNLSISYISYASEQKEGVKVNANETTTIDASLQDATTKLEEVKVVGKANRETEAMLLIEQKTAVLATQAIGAMELSRKGVSDAEGAVTKVSGISKQEGSKNVIIRGLGDRYNATTLNGFALPSEDPEYKNIALDFFSSNMIQSVEINKVFGATHTGDVGGALININSKELMKSSEFEVSLSAGVNSQSTGKEFLKADGVNSFGYANTGSRPANIAGDNERVLIEEYSFQNSLTPTQTSTPINRGISIAGGKKFSDKKHSFYIIASYDNDNFIETGITRNTTTSNPEPFKDYNYTRYEQYTTHMGLGNLDFNFDKHQLQYNALYIHTNKQYYSEYDGKEGEIFQNVEDLGSKGLMIRQQINDNSILVNQILWKWNIIPRLTSDAGISHNYVLGLEPDRRVNYLSNIGDQELELRSGDARQQRFYSELTEQNINIRATLNYQLTDDITNPSSISMGYSGLFAQKNFFAPIYNQDWNVAVSDLPIYPIDEVDLDNDFTQENLDAEHFEIDLYEDKYNVEKYNNGGFVNLIYKIGNKLTTNIGLRVDQVYFKIDYDVNKGGSVDKTEFDSLFFLPSLNLKYDINSKHSIRFGSSVTYTMPQDKEISPFVYVGPVVSTSGNPDLRPSTNYNVDLKWDYYISGGEILTINGFYKYILDPIARVDQGNSAGILTYDNISESATAVGVELELRKNIFDINKGNLTHKLDLGINGSYIYTKMELTEEKIQAPDTVSALEGAAPIILNTDLTYKLKGTNTIWTNTLMVNYFSDKVHTIGTLGYKNIMEEGVSSLDFITSVTLKNNWKIGFKAKNLLNPNYELSREPNTGGTKVILDQYKKGISLKLSVTYKF
jgi:outer membrane receptor protein involved in Fe transport